MSEPVVQALGWVFLMVLAVALISAHYQEDRPVGTAQHGPVCPAPTTRSER